MAPLADYTTLRLGGPADRLVEARTEDELVSEARARARSSWPAGRTW